MPRPVAHLLDPALADAADPCAGYNPEAEPLEDRLYLPVGVDPHGDICGVVFAHPYPQSKEVLTQRIIRNNNLQDMRWLIETGVTTGCLVPGPARLRLRGHQRLLAGATQLSAPRRQCHCHGLRSPDQPRPWQWHARCHGRPQRRLQHHQGLQAGRVTCHAHPPGTVSLVARVLPLAPLPYQLLGGDPESYALSTLSTASRIRRTFQRARLSHHRGADGGGTGPAPTPAPVRPGQLDCLDPPGQSRQA
jgi:hypothetical protein